MPSQLPAFCNADIALACQTRFRSGAPVARRSSLRRNSFIPRADRRASQLPLAHSSRRFPRCQIPGNIEDLPAERIPMDPDALPPYWARPGVYGIYNSTKDLQYVAAVRDVRQAIATHVRVINDPDKLFAVRMLTVDNVDDAPLGMMAENWVMAHHEYGPGLPPGNTEEEPLWRVEEKKDDVYFTQGIDEDMIEGEIKRILRDNRVVLFMKGTRKEPKCGFSRTVVETLEELGADFVCVDCLDGIRNNGLREEIKRFSKWPTIPQLYVNGDFVGGADIVKTMKENGELELLLKESQAAATAL